MVGILILAFAGLLGACCTCQHKKEGAVKNTHTPLVLRISFLYLVRYAHPFFVREANIRNCEVQITSCCSVPPSYIVKSGN